MSLGFAGFLPSPSKAQTQSCTALPKPPDTLLKLADCCAASPQSNPSCRLSDPKDGYVIIKDNDPRKPQAYLILPIAKVTGVEDPLIFKPPVVDFWQHGWAQSATYPGRPPADTALAINSRHARSQNQLHIHISCVRSDVKSALLATPIPFYPDKPVALPLAPHQHVYEVVKVTGLAGPLSPFLLARDNPGAKADMGDQSIAVVGSAKADEYFVLSTHHGADNPAFAEELLNQSCND
jgi:CDP-diacylglycerol pyrophosphatase